MLECGSSQRRVANAFGVSQSVSAEHGSASIRVAQLPSAMLVVDNEQPRQDRTDFLHGQTSSLRDCDYCTKLV